MPKDHDYLVRACIIGQQSIGKTELHRALCEANFVHKIAYKSTLGVKYNSTIHPHDDTRIKFQLWDASGAPKFQAIVSAYCRSAGVVLLCFDPSQKDSLTALKPLIEVAQIVAPNAQFILVATRTDLSPHQVTEKDIETFKNDNSIPSAPIIHTSSKWHGDKAYEQSGITELKTTMCESARLFKAADEIANSSLFMKPTDSQKKEKHRGMSCSFLLNAASISCGLASVGLLVTGVALMLTLPALWPLGLVAGGAALLLGAGFFKAVKHATNHDTPSNQGLCPV